MSVKFNAKVKGLFAGAYSGLTASGILQRKIKYGGFRVLLYHSIDKNDPSDIFGIRVKPENFLQQMAYLKENRYNILSLSQIIKLCRSNDELPPNLVAITFDDGYKDNLYCASQILKSFGFPATIFVCLDYIENNKQLPGRGYWETWDFLSFDDMVSLGNCGIEIGAHGISHHPLSNLDKEKLENEVIYPKKKLEQYLKKEIKLFSYPHGAYNKTIINKLKEAGYLGACCSKGGLNQHDDRNYYELRRTEITAYDTIDDFKNKLEGFYDIFP